MNCECVSEFDAKLAEFGVRISTPFRFDRAKNQMDLAIEVKTVPIEGTRMPRKAPMAIATFCPFCGKRCEDIAKAEGRS